MKYIIDLDGTLLNGETANLDSVAFMKHLNATNTDYLVMTKVAVNNENPDIIILLDFEKENVCYDKLQEVFTLMSKGTPVINAFKSGLSLLIASPNELMVIGDDWKTDIKGGIEVGCKSALLKSGKYNEDDELHVQKHFV